MARQIQEQVWTGKYKLGEDAYLPMKKPAATFPGELRRKDTIKIEF